MNAGIPGSWELSTVPVLKCMYVSDQVKNVTDGYEQNTVVVSHCTTRLSHDVLNGSEVTSCSVFPIQIYLNGALLPVMVCKSNTEQSLEEQI